MSGFGTILRVTTFGESHCQAVGGILEGFPSNFTLDPELVQLQLDRRRAKGTISTARQESDTLQILSGLENNVTLGTPIGFMVKNKDIRPEDYHHSQGLGENYIPRPSHADFAYLAKYNIHASSGGGRSSARETISRVIGGAIAEQYLLSYYNCNIVAWVSEIHHLKLNLPNPEINLSREEIDASPVRCPDRELSEKMVNLINDTKQKGDSVGGVVEVRIYNPPIGLGEPCFNKVEALLAQAMMSIPATKGFEIGAGFGCTKRFGSENNDSFGCNNTNTGISPVTNHAGISPVTNHAGGTLGGITSGATIAFRVAFKPPSTISKPQETVNVKGEPVTLCAEGRHDPCIVHRAVPIVEAMAALTILDLALLQKRFC